MLKSYLVNRRYDKLENNGQKQLWQKLDVNDVKTSMSFSFFGALKKYSEKIKTSTKGIKK